MEKQKNPSHLEGRKQYDREFLVRLQSAPMSSVKPSNLPKLDIIKDKAHFQKVLSIPTCKLKKELGEMSFKVNKTDLKTTEKPIQNCEGFHSKENIIHTKSSDLNKLSLLTSLESDQDNSQFFSNSTKILSQSKENTEKDSVANVIHTRLEKTAGKEDFEQQTKIKVFGLKNVTELKKLKINPKTKVLIDDFLRTNNFEGTVEEASKLLFSVSNVAFIASSINLVLERSSQERQVVGQLLLFLFKENKITMQQLRKALVKVMEPFDLYFSLDLRKCVGEVLEPMLSLSKKERRPCRSLLQFFTFSSKAGKLLLATEFHTDDKTSSKINVIGLNSETPMQSSDGLGNEKTEIHTKESYLDLDKSSVIIRSDASNLESDQENNSFNFNADSLKSLSRSNIETNSKADHKMIEKKNVKENIDSHTKIKEADFTELGLKSTLKIKEKEIKIKTKVLIQDFLSNNNFEVSKSKEINLNPQKPVQNYEGHGSKEAEFHSKSLDLNKPNFIIRSADSSLESDQNNQSEFFSNSTKTLPQSKASNDTEKDSVTDASHKMMEQTVVIKNPERQTKIKETECIELGLNVIPELEKTATEIKTKLLIEKFLSNNDFEGAMKKVEELIPSDTYHLFISASIDLVLKSSSRDRWLVGRLLYLIVKQKTFMLENYSEGLVKFFGSVDIGCTSHIWDNIAEILEPILSLERKNYFCILKILFQPFIPSEMGDNLISAVLRWASLKRGIPSLKKRWEKTELQWTDFLRKETNLDEFLFKNKLTFLTSNKIPNAVAPILAEDSKTYLFNLLEKHEGIDKNVSNMPYRINNSQSQVPVMINTVPQQTGFQYNPFQMQSSLFHANHQIQPPISILHQQPYCWPYNSQQFPLASQQVFSSNPPGCYNNPLLPKTSLYTNPTPLTQFSKQMPQMSTKKVYPQKNLDFKKINTEAAYCNRKVMPMNSIEKKHAFDTEEDQRKNKVDVKAEISTKQSFVQSTEVSVPQCTSSSNPTNINNCDLGNKLLTDIGKSNKEKNSENIENANKRKATFSVELTNKGKKFDIDSNQNNNKEKTKIFSCVVDLNAADQKNDLSTHNSLANEKTVEISEKAINSPKLSEPERMMEAESNIVSNELSNNSSNIIQLSNSDSLKIAHDLQSFIQSSAINTDDSKVQEYVNNSENALASSNESKVVSKRKQMGTVKRKMLSSKNLRILIKESQKCNLIQEEMLKEQKRSNELLEKIYAMLSKSLS